MKAISFDYGNTYNPLGIVKNISETLSSLGEIEITYHKGRLFLGRLLLGRGEPPPVNESSKWNNVEISLGGRRTIEIFKTIYGLEGKFFDENFAENEIKQMGTLLSEKGVFIRNTCISRLMWIRIPQAFTASMGMLLLIMEYSSGDLGLGMIAPILIISGMMVLLSKS
jgi:hypothetical protein